MRPLTPARWVLLLAVIFGRAFAADPADSVFLFSYFVRNGEDGLHLAVSEDGLKWTALRDGASFLTPAVGENKLMRAHACCSGPMASSGWCGRPRGPA